MDICALPACAALGALGILWGGPEGMDPGFALLACRTMYFMPWLALGRWYRAALMPHDTLESCRYFALVTLAQLLLLYAGDGGVGGTPSWAGFPHGVAITMLAAVTGIAFWWRVCRLIAPHLSCGARKIVWALSDGSFSIMCLHIVGAFVLSSLFGIASTVTPLFGSWDAGAYLSSGAYRYLPHGIAQFSLLYVIFAIGFSLAVRTVWIWMRRRCAGVVAWRR